MLNGWCRRRARRFGNHHVGGAQLLATVRSTARASSCSSASAPSTGHCNTMGTAIDHECLAEAWDVAARPRRHPAPYRERGQVALSRLAAARGDGAGGSEALRHPHAGGSMNAIVVYSAIGGSTNAPIHLNAIARHAGDRASTMTGRSSVTRSPVGEYSTGRKISRRGRSSSGRRARDDAASYRARQHP